MSFDVLIGTICSYMLLLPEIRDVAPLGRWSQFHKFLRKADFNLTARNPPTVQLELIGLPFGVWGIRVSFGPGTQVLCQSSVDSSLRNHLLSLRLFLYDSHCLLPNTPSLPLSSPQFCYITLGWPGLIYHPLWS